ncbi:Hypothetical protein, putative [Bodo saltans]|uniref:Uncharacterized protein n=1 Tax=Bodo saltans TaxID=75058 RepID=A0A0S4JJM0_BODSA|nr:Hypothetical protein, putative [Bodo saltans]|eukprot:CUG90455.1 Hypothetical protein, putative [Bodo saltans]
MMMASSSSAAVFIPLVEDNWLHRGYFSHQDVAPATAQTNNNNNSHGHRCRPAADDEQHGHHENERGEHEVSTKLARARRDMILLQDPRRAYSHLQSLRMDCPSWRQRREVEDCAVELLEQMDNAAELALWLPVVVDQQSLPQNKLYKPNRSLMLRGLTAKEFQSLNAAELVQRASVFSCLVRSGVSLTTGDDEGLLRETSLCAVVELCSALLRKPLRRDIFLWKQLASSLQSIVSRVEGLQLLQREAMDPGNNNNNSQCSSAGGLATALDVTKAVIEYINRIVVLCLVCRDRPVESEARSYGANRGVLDGANLLQHAGQSLNDAFHRWRSETYVQQQQLHAATYSSAVVCEDDAAGGSSSNPSPLHFTQTAVLGAMTQVMGDEEVLVDHNAPANKSAPTTPREGKEQPVVDVPTAATISTSNSLREASDRREVSIAEAHFLAYHVVMLACATSAEPPTSSSFVAALADRLLAPRAPNNNTTSSDPWVAIYSVVLRVAWIYLLPNMELVFGQQKYAAPTPTVTAAATAARDAECPGPEAN